MVIIFGANGRLGRLHICIHRYLGSTSCCVIACPFTSCHEAIIVLSGSCRHPLNFLQMSSGNYHQRIDIALYILLFATLVKTFFCLLAIVAFFFRSSIIFKLSIYIQEFLCVLRPFISGSMLFKLNI